MNAEYYLYIIAALGVLLLILLFDMMNDARRPEPVPFKWGDKRKKPKQDATWGSHFVLGFPALLLAVFLSFKLIPAIMAN